jgi:hypothetical protein
MILGLPLLVVSFYFARKNLLKGKLMLAGTLGYFLYTYISYSFLTMYNPMFLIYVILMSASFFAFILTVMSFDFKNISTYFNSKMPVKFIGGFLIFLAVMIGFMWLGRIVPPLINGTSPEGLEHYTTLVIQALDLGFIVPAAMLSGVLLIKRKPFGYLLSSIIIIKGVTLLTAITAMAIRMLFAGVKVSFVELILFPLFNLIAVYCLILIMKNIMEHSGKILNDKEQC